MRIFFLALEVFPALLVGGIMLLMAGANPLVGYMLLLEGAFGDIYKVIDVLVRTTPLLLVGLGIIVTFRCRVINLGAEGQIYMGAIVATWVGITLGGFHPLILLPLTIIGGFLAAGLWASIVGILKIKLDVNEIISFLMMNYIAIWFMDYLLTGPMQDPLAGGYPLSPPLPSATWLPTLLGTRLHAGFFVSILTVIFIYLLFVKTTLGYRIKVIGTNLNMARYGGINVSIVMLIVVFLSGGLSGLAGTFEIIGIHHRLIKGFNPGYGWSGIAVARAAGLKPLSAVPVAFFFGALSVGVDFMARKMGIPIFLSFILYALVVIFVIAGEGLREILSERRKRVD